jgi:hypothetical protein
MQVGHRSFISGFPFIIVSDSSEISVSLSDDANADDALFIGVDKIPDCRVAFSELKSASSKNVFDQLNFSFARTSK